MRQDDVPRDLRPVLAAIASQARERQTPVYLVGGVVRDRLLGRPVFDVDLAVEGDALALARAAAEGLPAAELRIHEAFGTAALLVPEGRRVDLAGTRSESYADVAALPTVRPATLEEDLLRRDFTVNSMAVPLDDPAAEPIDPSGGRADLEARRLRVHHERSFLDDPTRILRGVRFEGRLGFGFEAETERLARAACAAGALMRLSADRLRAELDLLFEEDVEIGAAWRRLAGLGLLPGIGLRADEAAAARLGRVARTLEGWVERHGEQSRVGRSKVLFGAVLLAQPPRGRVAAAARLGVPVGCAYRFEELVDALARPGLLPHESVAILEQLDLEELVLFEALAGQEVGDRIAVYLARQRRLELSIDGGILLAHGFATGPRIGEALRATRRARLDGRITAGEELAFALAALRGENRDA